MDLASRKLALIQTLLSLEDNQVIASIEELLNQQLAGQENKYLKPISLEQFHKDIRQSVEDSENDNGMEANELLAEIKNWK